jgi:hypothetical protein
MRGQEFNTSKWVKWLLGTALVSAIIHDQGLPPLGFPNTSLTHHFFDYLTKTSLTFTFILLVIAGAKLLIFKTMCTYADRYVQEEYNREQEAKKKKKKTSKSTKFNGGE